MNVGIFAKVFEPRPVDGIFSAVAAAGYASVQFNLTCAGLPMLPGEPVPEQLLREIGESAARHRVSLPAISGTFNLVHPDPAEVEAGLRGLRHLGGVCRRLKIPVITLCTGTRDPENMWREHPANGTAAAWRDLVTNMQRALAAAGEGVSLAIEPEPANVVHSALLARRLIDEVGNPRLGVTFDAANLIKARSGAEDREIFDQAFRLVGHRAVLAHAKDRLADGTIVPAGRGAVDFPYFIRGLRAAGYDGALIAHGLEEKDATATAAHLRGIIG